MVIDYHCIRIKEIGVNQILWNASGDGTDFVIYYTAIMIDPSKLPSVGKAYKQK
jgi:hypothetical protein